MVPLPTKCDKVTVTLPILPGHALRVPLTVFREMICCPTMPFDGEAGGGSAQGLWAVDSGRALVKSFFTGLKPSNQHIDNDVGGGKARFRKLSFFPLRSLSKSHKDPHDPFLER